MTSGLNIFINLNKTRETKREIVTFYCILFQYLQIFERFIRLPLSFISLTSNSFSNITRRDHAVLKIFTEKKLREEEFCLQCW